MFKQTDNCTNGQYVSRLAYLLTTGLQKHKKIMYENKYIYYTWVLEYQLLINFSTLIMYKYNI